MTTDLTPDPFPKGKGSKKCFSVEVRGIDLALREPAALVGRSFTYRLPEKEKPRRVLLPFPLGKGSGVRLPRAELRKALLDKGRRMEGAVAGVWN